MIREINNKYTYVKLPEATLYTDHVPDVGKVIGTGTLEEIFSESVEDRTGTFILSTFSAERCALIAKEYADKKLQELEKWVEESQDRKGWVSYYQLKEKIKSLKQ